MANALALPHIFEISFDALTAAVGGLVILLALRMAPALTLSAHRLALRISIVAAALIIAAQMAEVLADFSRLSTTEDAAADVGELISLCFVGLALHLIRRAEKEEISSLRRAADVDHLTGLVSRSFFHRAAERRIELYKRNKTCRAWSRSSRKQTLSYTGPRERARTGWPQRGGGKKCARAGHAYRTFFARGRVGVHARAVHARDLLFSDW
jgi:hypothetical protein